jgi:thiol:disulfide interchange protein DsbD
VDLIAQPAGPTATVELVLPRSTVAPGETLPIGVKFTMAPGWHIYWKNPGDSGLPPTFRWNLPGGGASRAMRGSEWTATEPAFPVPVSWTDAAGLVGYGYSGTVIFPAELKIPASATPGQVVEVGVLVDYMVCKEICLTESGSAKVQLTVAAGSAETEEIDSESARQLKEAIARLPQPGKATEGATPPDDGGIVLETTIPSGAKNLGVFPAPPEGVVVEEAKVQAEGDLATVTLRIRRLAGIEVTARQFEVVVGYDLNEGRRGVSLKVPLPPPGE